MRKYRLLWGLALLTVALSGLGEAFTYHVATTGDNARSCETAKTEGTPKQTLASVRACPTAGDFVNIRAGTYQESVSDTTGTLGTGTNFGAGAITYQKHPGDGDVIWKTTATSVQLIPADFALYLVGTASQYLIFKEIIFDGNNRLANHVAVTGNPGPTGAHHIRFQTCKFRNARSEIGLSYTHHNEFLGGEIYDNNDSTGLRHGIYIATQASDNIVDGMRIYNNLGYGVHLWGSSATAHRNIIRNNIIYNNATAQGQNGIIYTGGDDGQIYNNTIYSNGGGGIAIAYSGPANGILVANNTIVSNHGGRPGLWIAGGSGHVVRNNIIYQNGTDYTNSNPGGTTASNNLIATNPIFMNAGARDYHLQAGSPAIDTGFNLTATIPTDQAGTTNTVPMEIGAFNYGSVVLPNVIVFTQPPGSQIVGTPLPTVQACVNDSAGVRQTAYATNIGFTLSNDANPTTTLTGGTAGAPTAGCKTATLSLDKTGTGFKVKATTGALEVESGPFNSLALALPPSVLRLIRVPAPTP